jgi:hypothetical protein
MAVFAPIIEEGTAPGRLEKKALILSHDRPIRLLRNLNIVIRQVKFQAHATKIAD